MKADFVTATTKHIPDILAMMESFYAIDGYPFDADAAEKCLQEFTANPDLGRIWIIKADDEIAGYVTLAFGFSFEYLGRDAFIDELYLEPGYRSKGIGTQVMSFVQKIAPELNIKALHLQVEKHNSKGIGLYEKRGFKDYNRILLTNYLNK